MKPEVAPELRDLFERVETAYQRYYVRQLRDRLEQTAFGKYMAFHVDSGEYVVADSQDEVLAQFRARFPAALACTLRIGNPRLVA